MTTTDTLLDTKGVTVAFSHPTPQVAPGAWSCADSDEPDLFAPTSDDALARALEFCGTCAVRDLCLELGTSRDEWGVWGGVLLENGKPLAKVRAPGRPKKATAA